MAYGLLVVWCRCVIINRVAYKGAQTLWPLFCGPHLVLSSWNVCLSDMFQTCVHVGCINTRIVLMARCDLLGRYLQCQASHGTAKECVMRLSAVMCCFLHHPRGATRAWSGDAQSSVVWQRTQYVVWVDRISTICVCLHFSGHQSHPNMKTSSRNQNHTCI